MISDDDDGDDGELSVLGALQRKEIGEGGVRSCRKETTIFIVLIMLCLQS